MFSYDRDCVGEPGMNYIHIQVKGTNCIDTDNTLIFDVCTNPHFGGIGGDCTWGRDMNGHSDFKGDNRRVDRQGRVVYNAVGTDEIWAFAC